MPASHFEASSLLHYNSDFRVLICRKCQHAIQKSAIDGHLLKHKIYRSARQALVAEIARLDLPEPEDVLPPPSSLPPVESLPVLQGFRCTVSGCRHLTISEKRAKRHWSELHRRGEDFLPLCEVTCPVNLQTFFKGTKVRYFEVSSVLHSDNEQGSGEEGEVSDRGEADDEGEEGEEDLCRTHWNGIEPGSNPDGMAINSMKTNPVLLKLHQAHGRSPRSAPDSQNFSGLDLDTLRYFHHYFTVTAPTLPGTSVYWQRKVVAEALHQRQMMRAMLAISAGHLAVLATDARSIDLHMHRQAMFFREITGLESTVQHQSLELDNNASAILGQLMALAQYARWAAIEAKTSHNLIAADPPGFDAMLDALRALEGMSPSNGLEMSTPQTDQHYVAQANQSSNSLDPNTCMLMRHIEELPYRMAETFGKPDSAPDLFATLSAIDSLIQCCKISFASNKLGSVWEGALDWLIKLSSHFNAMIVRRDPAAMVVLAHWAAILVKRAERVGFWFLNAGGNVSVLMNETPAFAKLSPSSKPDGRSSHVIVTSARTEKALLENKDRLRRYLLSRPETQLASLGYTTTARRMHHNLRIAYVADSVANLAKQLEQPVKASTSASSIVLAFTGQGSQYSGMGNVLYATSAIFRRMLDSFQRTLSAQGIDCDFLPLITGSSETTNSDTFNRDIQAATVALEIALARCWHSLGLRPSLLITTPSCKICCVNGPASTVVGGPVAAIAALEEYLKSSDNADCTRLKAQHAFHTRQMDSLLGDLEAHALSISYQVPTLSIASTLLAEVVQPNEKEVFNAQYIRRHTREPVAFFDTVRKCEMEELIDDSSLIIEIGPHPTCVNLMASSLKSTKPSSFPSLRRGQNDGDSISKCAAGAYRAQVPNVRSGFHKDHLDEFRFINGLPTYAFDLRDFWASYKNQSSQTTSSLMATSTCPSKLSSNSFHGVAEVKKDGSTLSIIFVADISGDSLAAAIGCHVVDGVAICPANVFIDMAYTTAAKTHILKPP